MQTCHICRVSRPEYPRDRLTAEEAARVQRSLQTLGAADVARKLGIDVRTLYKAVAGVAVHRLTAQVVRANIRTI